jgi:hypothetical protein
MSILITLLQLVRQLSLDLFLVGTYIQGDLLYYSSPFIIAWCFLS